MFRKFSNKDTGYEIEQSLLFDGSVTHLERTPAVSGNRTTNTFSTWVKRSGLGTQQHILDVRDGSNRSYIAFDVTGRIEIDGGDSGIEITTDASFNDASSWYHIVMMISTTDPVENERVKLWVNGIQQIDLFRNKYPAQNATPLFGDNKKHTIGDDEGGGVEARYFDGYLSETHFIDGQALGPEHFALTDSNGVYNPIRYTGDYGTNGFYLPFEASDIGADESGNNNDFTPSGFTSESVVADSPSNNYSTLMPFLAWNGPNGRPPVTFSNGNRTVYQGGSDAKQGAYIESIQLSTGKFWRSWYIANNPNEGYNYMYVGFGSAGPGLKEYRIQDIGICVNSSTGSVKFWDGAAPTVVIPSLAYGQGGYHWICCRPRRWYC